MPVYRTISEYQTSDGVINQTPVWAIGVVRFKTPVTFRRSVGAGEGSAQDAVEERPPILIVSDVMSLSVNSNKNAHTSSLTATLYPGQMDYLSNILPGDWVFAWIRNDGEAGLRDLIGKMTDPLKSPNEFMDGLKFVGKATIVRFRKTVSPTGQKQTTYTLSATGFSEMDGVAMRDPNMVAVNAAPKNFFDFGASLNDITARGGSEQGYIDGGKAIPTFAQAFFGAGAFSNVNRQMSLGKIRVSPNQAYAVPKTVAEWLGARVPSTVYTYADLLDIIVGRQTYQDAPDYRMFIPELTQTSVNHYDTLHPLFSFIQPAMPSDGTIWNLMSTMLNSPLNEMYVTLRVGPHGRVVPTLVARQAPYNTPAVAKEEPVGV